MYGPPWDYGVIGFYVSSLLKLVHQLSHSRKMTSVAMRIILHHRDLMLSSFYTRGFSSGGRVVTRKKIPAKKAQDVHWEMVGGLPKPSLCSYVDAREGRGLVGNSDFGFRFLGRPEFGIPLPSSGIRNFPAEKQIGKPENRSSRKSGFRFRFFRNSGIPLITYIGTLYILIL